MSDDSTKIITPVSLEDAPAAPDVKHVQELVKRMNEARTAPVPEEEILKEKGNER